MNILALNVTRTENLGQKKILISQFWSRGTKLFSVTNFPSQNNFSLKNTKNMNNILLERFYEFNTHLEEEIDAIKFAER